MRMVNVTAIFYTESEQRNLLNGKKTQCRLQDVNLILQGKGETSNNEHHNVLFSVHCNYESGDIKSNIPVIFL